MKHNKTITAFILFLGAAALMPAEAWSFTINTDLMTYQGRLRESGAPVDGNRDVQISICDDFTGGSCYPTGVQTVSVFKGLFRTTFTLPGAVDLGTVTVAAWFLEVQVGPEGGGLSTLVPREQLTKVPYSIFAGTVAAAGIKPGTIVPGVHFSSHVGVGTSNPIRELEVIGAITADRYEIAGSTVLADLGSGSFAVGLDAGRVNTTGTGNAFLGTQAGYSNTTGAFNQFVGSAAGYSNINGTHNAYLGYQAGFSNTAGNYNSILGSQAGFNNTGNNGSFFGYQAGYSNTTGWENTFVGFESGRANTTGNTNSFLGHHAGYSNNAGAGNSFFGTSVGYSNTVGNANAFFGFGAGYFNTGGNRNTAIGHTAGYLTTGDFNTFLGFQAGYSNTASDGNVFLGYQAGYDEVGGNKLYISNSNTVTPLIWGDFSTGDVVINGTLAQTSAVSCSLQADGTGILTCISDERLKDILGPFTRGVEDLKGIVPVTFRFKEDSGFTGTFTGFTAQNVAEHIPEAVTEQPSGMLGLSDRPILATMLNAILEQQKRIDEQQKRIEELEAKLEQR